MRSRAGRLSVCTMVWLVFGAAAYFLFITEQDMSARRAALRAFDVHAREAVDALADLRAAQQAYVAEGQGVAFWMPKVSALTATASSAIGGLRESALSADTLAALTAAVDTLTEFGSVDQRAREYISSDQELMAADVVFTEGGEAAAMATRHVETSAIAEHQAFDAFEAGKRRLELYALIGAAAWGALLALFLALVKPVSAPAAPTLTLLSPIEVAPASLPRNDTPALKAAAQLCSDFARTTDLEDLKKLLGRIADLMDASGLIVWLANPKGGELRPVLAHGYTSQVLARMPAIARSADNAAAAAYRSGALQIVLSRPGSSHGAIVAPLLSADGCIGALTAEIRGGAESSDNVQALAAIFASQLVGVISSSAATEEAASLPLEATQRAANS